MYVLEISLLEFLRSIFAFLSSDENACASEEYHTEDTARPATFDGKVVRDGEHVRNTLSHNVGHILVRFVG